MANELIEIKELKKQLQDNPKNTDEIVESYTKGIVAKIESLSQKIDKAKQLSREAENAKGDWRPKILGGKSATDKRSLINTQAITQQNEAMTEMNNMIQSVIALIVGVGIYANKLIEQLSLIAVNGFRDSNGRMIKLNENTKEAVNLIIQQAKNAVERHERIENLTNEINEKLLAKDELDSEQTRQIENLSKKMLDKDSLDSKQDIAIKSLQQRNNLALIVSFLALILSAVSIISRFV